MITALAAILLLAAPPDLTAAAFAELHASLTSAPPEKWQTVPWRIDLLAARDEAAASGKPVFIWSMNGHPLGCT